MEGLGRTSTLTLSPSQLCSSYRGATADWLSAVQTTTYSTPPSRLPLDWVAARNWSKLTMSRDMASCMVGVTGWAASRASPSKSTLTRMLKATRSSRAAAS